MKVGPVKSLIFGFFVENQEMTVFSDMTLSAHLFQLFDYELLISRSGCPYFLKLQIPVSKGKCLLNQKVGSKEESMKIFTVFLFQVFLFQGSH